MKFKDHYKTLGVAPDVSTDALKDAYHKLARAFHPDVNRDPGATKRFSEISEANEVLKDPEKRAAYDQLRAGGWQEGQEMDPSPAEQRAGRRAGRRTRSPGGPEARPAGDFSDAFESFFGRQAGNGGFAHEAFHERGADLAHTVAVSLEESYQGGERQLRLQLPTLNGQGERVSDSRTLSVKIPKGVVQGTRMRLRGQGQPGSTAELNGDLFLDIELTPHRLYGVSGSDLSLELPITPWEAVLGAQVEVPTLGGPVNATIPAGAQQGLKLRLKGRGLPSVPPGDQYLVIAIAMPPTVDEKTKDLYRGLAKESTFDPRAKLRL